MATFMVFYRNLSELNRAIVNKYGWSSDVGTAYLKAEPFGGNKPQYLAAMEYSLFEKAAFIKSADDLDEVYSLMQNSFTEWKENSEIVCTTEFPRSMMIGDVVYNVTDDEWHYVDSFGFGQVTDEIFIEHLRAKR